MVVLQPDLSRSHGLADQANHLAARHGGRVVDVWESVVYGFAAEMPEAAAIAMANDPLVRWVEEDQWMGPKAIHRMGLIELTSDPCLSICRIPTQ